MPGYHGEESPFEASFRMNAAPLLKRIEDLEQEVARLKKGKAKKCPK